MCDLSIHITFLKCYILKLNILRLKESMKLDVLKFDISRYF